MIIHHGEPCISCEHYSTDASDENHWVCDFDHNTCPHIEALHNAVGYKKQNIDVLDKIRAEIDEYRNSWKPRGNSIDNAGWRACNKCIEIIDKYKASPTGAERGEE